MKSSIFIDVVLTEKEEEKRSNRREEKRKRPAIMSSIDIPSLMCFGGERGREDEPQKRGGEEAVSYTGVDRYPFVDVFWLRARKRRGNKRGEKRKRPASIASIDNPSLMCFG